MSAAQAAPRLGEQNKVARYLGPVCRLCRREGLKLFLKGERCYTDKCAIERRNYPPGAHGQARTRFSEFAIRLREKQKVRRIYGLMETQFKHYFEMAERMPGITGENLLILLERRLDSMVYRLGFASSLAQARQIVRHGHIEVDNKPVTVPSYLVRGILGQAIQYLCRARAGFNTRPSYTVSLGTTRIRNQSTGKAVGSRGRRTFLRHAAGD
jgi:ribosomal protein S4